MAEPPLIQTLLLVLESIRKSGNPIMPVGLIFVPNRENEIDFYKRKNKFLNHLIGRFAEKFTDYALLTIKISGKLKAPSELIEDKLAFLNAYPKISSAKPNK